MKNIKLKGRPLSKKELQGIYAGNGPQGYCSCTGGLSFPVFNCGQCNELCRKGFICVGPPQQ